MATVAACDREARRRSGGDVMVAHVRPRSGRHVGRRAGVPNERDRSSEPLVSKLPAQPGWCANDGRFQRTHGQSRSRDGRPSLTYVSWMAMRRRCADDSRHTWRWYGGQGVVVCERWQSFDLFLSDMGERPSKAHSIDRIDSDKDYEPGNCRWATWTEQARHRSNTKLTEALVLEIHGRIEHGEKQASVAKRMGLTKWRVAEIRSGRRWKEFAL